jgi:SAM-dependent methyltransferase
MMVGAFVMGDGTRFVPALGFDVLTPLYDPVVRLTLREEAIKRRLVERAAIWPGMRVLDFGCGTGTLVRLVAESCPGAHLIGVDVDPAILALARQKLARSGIDVEWHCGRLEEAGVPDGSLDRVLTSLVLHHLTTSEKEDTLATVRRLLRPGGELHVADFGPPHNLLMRAVAQAVRWFDGADRVGANLDGRLPALIGDAGFVEVGVSEPMATPFGTLVYLRARTTRSRS